MTWYRGHQKRYGPLYFNRTMGRWADPDGVFGTLYVGESDYCAFIEAFNQQIGRLARRGYYISEQTLLGSCLCPVEVTRPARLVDLTTGTALRQIGADNRICDGPHDISQRWARALSSHPALPDGLYYRSRIAPELFSIAVFDRVEPALRVDCSRNVLTRRAELARILDYFDCALLP